MTAINNVTHLRCSGLPLTVLCQASLDSDLVIDSGSPEAALGTAVHTWLALAIGSTTDPDSVVEVLGDDADEFRMLTRLGLRAWNQLRGYFPKPTTELAMSAREGGIELSGHADVLSTVEDPADGLGEVRALDWKSGREDVDHDAQLKGYGWLALQTAPWAERASVCLVRLRDQTADWAHFSRSELAHWFESVRQLVLRTPRTFNPGSHCGFCRRGPTCPAKTAMLDQAVCAIIGSDLAAGVVLTPEHLAQLLDRVKLVEKACDTARALVKASVIAAGGKLPTGDGRELAIIDQTKRFIEYGPGAAVLTQALGADRLARLLKISKGDVEAAIKETAPPRGKGKAVAELLEKLDSAGAIRTETTPRLEIRRLVPAIEVNMGNGSE